MENIVSSFIYIYFSITKIFIHNFDYDHHLFTIYTHLKNLMINILPFYFILTSIHGNLIIDQMDRIIIMLPL